MSARHPRSQVAVPLLGLAMAVAGLLVQWVAHPDAFEQPAWGGLPGDFPPGVVVIAIFAALTLVVATRWWAALLPAAIGAWILVGGIGTGEMQGALSRGTAGSVSGLAVMSAGLLLAMATGARTAYVRRRRGTSQSAS